MKNLKSAVSSAQSRLEDLQALVGEAEALMKKSVTGPSAEVLGNLRDRFEDAQERFAEAYVGAKKQVVAGAKYTDKAVRSHPYETIAITAVIALAVGYCIGHRSNEE